MVLARIALSGRACHDCLYDALKREVRAAETDAARLLLRDKETSMSGKRIKVAIVINDFLVGGAQKLVADQMKFFDRTKFDVSLITLAEFPERPTLYNLLPEDIQTSKLSFTKFSDIKSWFRLVREFKKIKPDVVISHSFFSNTVCRVLKPLCGYRAITVEHNTYTDRKYKRILVDRILSHITFKIVAVSRTVADFTAKQERIPRNKFVVIHNGVDVRKMQTALEVLPSKEELKQELGFQRSDKILLTVARLQSQKNQKLLLEGFALFHKRYPDYKLAIVGDGIMRPKLDALARELELGDSVIFFGLRYDVERFYKASDVFILTSDIEGFSIVGIEAMSCGLPMVSTKTAGPDEYIEEGENGFFIHERTAEAVARSLEQVVAVGPSEFAGRALETVQRYDIHANTKQYERLLAESLLRDSLFMQLPLKYCIARFIGTRRWLRIGIRYHFFWQLHRYSFSVPFFGYRYSGNLDDHIDRQVFLFGAYEYDELMLMKRFLSKDAVVLDVGSNTGHHSLFFSRFAKLVHAFDPYQKVIDVAEARIKENKIDNIFTHTFGLGDKDAIEAYYEPADYNQGVGSFVKGPDNFKNNTINLIIKNGDTFVESLNLNNIDLIKIDVEGYETEVLNGLQTIIAKHRPVVFFEFKKGSERFGSYSSVVSYFPDKYDFYMIKANRPVVWFLNNPQPEVRPFDYEHPVGENVLAVPKEKSSLLTR